VAACLVLDPPPGAHLHTLLFALALALPSLAANSDPIADTVGDDPIASTATPDIDTDGARTIDLVVCLDTSGSMSNLIDSARGRLWDIVNRLNTVAPDATIRVGLLTYGSPSGSTAARGWVIEQSDLTTDLDTVYSHMMALKTSGGDEYVGWVMHQAVESMSWTPGDAGVRLMFVAGNESADQGRATHDFRDVAVRARENGILVNALFAGPKETGAQEHWAELANAGKGAYAAIEMKRGTVVVASPVDQRLHELNSALNDTYVPYGSEGRAGKARQEAMDVQAGSMGLGVLGSRAGTKSGKAYKNSHWDVLDAVDEGQLDLDDGEGLPEELKPMSVDERRVWVGEKQAERAQLQAEIKELTAERARYVEAERKKARAENEISFDDALIGAAEAALE
jgi:hypothetical protein